jgi:hypothetical protein
MGIRAGARSGSGFGRSRTWNSLAFDSIAGSRIRIVPGCDRPPLCRGHGRSGRTKAGMMVGKEKNRRTERPASRCFGRASSTSRVLKPTLVLWFLSAALCWGQAVAGGSPQPESLITGSNGCSHAAGQAQSKEAASFSLSEKQKAELKSLLGESFARAQIHVLPADNAAASFGNDLRSVFHDSGWDAGDQIHYDCALPTDLTGVVLLVNHRDFPESNLLQIALRRAGIAVAVQVDDAQTIVHGKDLVFIAIGAMSQSVR